MTDGQERGDPPDTDLPAAPSDEGGDLPEMTLLEHLDDLRVALGRSVLAFLLAVLLLVFFLPGLTDVLQLPYRWAQRAADADELMGLINIRPMGVFSVVLQVLFLGGLSISLPFILYFVSGFVAPALTARERRILIPGLATGFILFLAGASFAFFFLLPATLRVSMFFNQLLGLELLWNATDYYHLVVWLTILIGLLFEFPLVLVVLSWAGILKVETMRQQRRLVLVILLVLSAIVTPTGDPVTLIAMTLPLYGLFELAVAVAARIPTAGPRTVSE